MKKTLAALSAISIFLHLDSPIYAENQQAETDQVIVTMEENAVRPVKNGEVIPVEGQDSQLVSVEVPEGETVESFMDELGKRSDVESVEPDHLIKLAYIANDPYVSLEQYHHRTIGSARAWDKTFGSPDVVVAVIDDGADLRHPDLAGKFVSPYDIVKETGTVIPAGIHGTHVAGIIGSSIDNEKMGAGVAPKTGIMPINVFSGEYAYTSDVIEGIDYAMKNGADIINLSLGGEEPSEALETAVQRANAIGVVLLAAAGNDGENTPNYPAAYPEVISVGSTTSADALSDFSNFGSTIDIVAPGSSIQSTLPGDSFGSMSGTSMATPVVAGVAALIMADNPELSNEHVKKRLYETAKDLGAPGRDDLFGHGRVDAKDALLLAPAKPEVERVTTQSLVVKGKAEAGTLVAIEKDGTILGTGTATANETFSIAIPQQKAGAILTVTATDQLGKVSEKKKVTVADVTAPNAPVVISLYNTETSITGQAETGSTVYAYAGSKEIGKATAADGNFTMKIAKQPTGLSVSLVAVDAVGNESQAAKTVVADGSVKVVVAAYDKLKISWSRVSGADGYEIYRSSPGSKTYSKISSPASSTLSYTDMGLATGKTYYYKVRAYQTIKGKKVYGPYTSNAIGKPAVSGVGSVKSVSAGYNKNKISWSKVAGASGYAVYQATSKTGTYSNIKTIGSGSTLNYTSTDLTAGKTYYYKVRAYYTVNKKKYFGPYSNIVSAKPTVSLVSSFKAAASGYSKNKISWARVSGASGYAVYQATSKTGKYSNVKTIGSGSRLSYTKTGLSTGKTYYYKVRAYRTVNGKKYFGPYSKIASAKSAVSQVSSVKSASSDYRKNKISWSKVTGASGYTVYQATSKTGTYRNIKTTGSGKSLSYTKTGLTSGKIYYYKVRAYRTVNGKKYFGPYSRIDSARPM
ncbi:S8 family serine peptidase [Planomicrobium sp. CPCC 101110]|uniref:S8 family serine peptidase n=1 Tax=Planomicrobium sp. CPCC 101110 TaxID=2599619 RepID=UPI0011B486D6|nr:S8 family serine peptidase [Planomicrobium sp. CPCC 101110]TWT27798.1 S8 family serine peptidase [Planomicrobium sp. CPCC 101110]